MNFIDETDATVLVLSQIPGKLFGGGDEVYKGMLQAIKYLSEDLIKREINLLLDIKKDKYNIIKNKFKIEINST